jgi:formylglycine-generating enzyme required for sulfatase activity
LRRPADWALFVVAQVLPLSIPEHRRGDRGDVFRDCEACPEMIELKPGAFLMGSPVLEVGRDANEGPRRLVTISNPFALGRFEVTSAQWNACVADGGCGDLLGADQTPSDGNIPVVVGWDDAKKYVNWLSDKTGFAYYLPSEKEWEYAARAGTTSAYPWGDSEGQGFANCKSCGSRPSNGLSRVGSFAANPFGFYDMHGNVREWAVCYGEQPGCSDRVLRGGSWRDSDGIRSAYRSFNFDRRDDTGFRVAKKLDLFPNQPR